MSTYFKLFANCIPVRGYKRSIICDLQLNRFIYIPNKIFAILHENKAKEINYQQLLKKFDDKTQGLKRFVNYFIENNYGFITENPNDFPELDLSWDYPSKITNAIIDLSHNSKYNIHKFLKEINELGTPAIQLRFFNKIKWEEILQLLVYIDKNDFSFESIEIIAPYNPKFKHVFRKLSDYNSMVVSTIIYGSTINKSYFIKENLCHLTYIKNKFENENSCGIISYNTFNVNLFQFCESQSFNTCLNRKLSIDQFGNIKNCPSSSKIFGHIDKINISDVVDSAEFKYLWNIKKNDIKICSICEYRYMCNDCRIFISDEKDILSKPLKCSYNPITSLWEN